MTTEIDIVGVCGSKGSGKNTIADHLFKHHGYMEISFARTVKKIVSELFGWQYKMLLGDTEESRIFRETIDEWWTLKLGMGNITPRFILQHIGTDVMRNHFHPDIWLLTVEKRMYDIMKEFGNNKFVIPDLRFMNEFKWIKSFPNAKVISVHRGEVPEYYDDIRNGHVENVDGVHISEITWMTFKEDYCIHNNSTIDELCKTIDIIFK
jgi:hypothetical protein